MLTVICSSRSKATTHPVEGANQSTGPPGQRKRSVRSAQVPQQLRCPAEEAPVFRAYQTEAHHQRIARKRDNNEAQHALQRYLTKAEYKDRIGCDARKYKRCTKGQEIPAPNGTTASRAKKQ